MHHITRRQTSTTTSLFPVNKGMAEAWTGVILEKPIEETASRIHSARGGVRASQALGSFFSLSPGAIVESLTTPRSFPFLPDPSNLNLVLSLSVRMTLVQERTSVFLPVEKSENHRKRHLLLCPFDPSHTPLSQITTLLLAWAWDHNIIMQCSFALLNPLHWSR